MVLLALTRMGGPVEEPGSAPAVTPVARVRSSLWSEVADGVRLMGQQRTLSTLLIVVFLMELGFSGPMMAGVPLLAAETGWGVAAVGWVLAGFGLGAAAAAGVLTWRRQVRRTGRGRAGRAGRLGLGVVGLGLLPDAGLARPVALLLAGLLGLVAGLGSGFFGTLVTSVVLGLARHAQIGRVMGALSFSSWRRCRHLRADRAADRLDERAGPVPGRRRAGAAGRPRRRHQQPRPPAQRRQPAGR